MKEMDPQQQVIETIHSSMNLQLFNKSNNISFDVPINVLSSVTKFSGVFCNIVYIASSTETIWYGDSLGLEATG